MWIASTQRSPLPRTPAATFEEGQLLFEVPNRRPIATPVLRVAQRKPPGQPVLIDVAEIPPGERVERFPATPTHHPARPHPAKPPLALLLVDSPKHVLPMPIVIPYFVPDGTPEGERPNAFGVLVERADAERGAVERDVTSDALSISDLLI